MNGTPHAASQGRTDTRSSDSPQDASEAATGPTGGAHGAPETDANPADAFNARYPVGTPVLAYPGLRPDDPFVVTARKQRAARGHADPACTDLVSSEAQVLGGHTPVVWVDGHAACIALTHINPIEETP